MIRERPPQAILASFLGALALLIGILEASSRLGLIPVAPFLPGPFAASVLILGMLTVAALLLRQP
jgi:hypothetical protein